MRRALLALVLPAVAFAVALTSAGPAAARRADEAEAVPLRLNGSVEPVRSYPIPAPRLTGGSSSTAGAPANAVQLVIVHLVKSGTMVRKGDLLVEFDRAGQLKNAGDRQAEYKDFVEQINRKRGEQITARAHDDAELAQGENAVKAAALDVEKNEILPKVDAELNVLALEAARAKLLQLRRTYDLKRKSEAADVTLLEIERDRAGNAWKHAEENAEKMRILAPVAGMAVLKTTWKQGTMGEVQEGEEVRPGLPILDIVDTTEMRVRARVNQADVDRVQVGQIARITLDSYPSRVFAGRVERLSPIGTTSWLSNRMRTFLAVLSIEGTDPHLLPDLAVAVDFDR
jgi:HlyD family secretion protein